MSAERKVFGERLRQLRIGRNLSLREVARASAGGISYSHVSKLERGQIDSPTLGALRALAGVYAVEFGALCELWCGHLSGAKASAKPSTVRP